MSEKEEIMLSKLILINEHKSVIKNNLFQKIPYHKESVALIYALIKMLLENKKIEEYKDIDMTLSKLENLGVLYSDNSSLIEIFSIMRSFMYRFTSGEDDSSKKLDDYNKVLPYLSVQKQYKKKIG